MTSALLLTGQSALVMCSPPGQSMYMHPFPASTLLVAVAEMGDKTQLLSFLLAARYRRPLPIIAGILVATLANHALSALLGAALAGWLDARFMQLIAAVLFIALGLWTLKADTLDASENPGRSGPFVASLLMFFFAEMGDKTQIATITLAAQYHSIFWVTLGTTMGMMIANVPAVLVGEKLLAKLPLRALRTAASAGFLAMGVLGLIGLYA